MSKIIIFLILLLVFLAYPDDDTVEYPEPADDATKTNDESKKWKKRD